MTTMYSLPAIVPDEFTKMECSARMYSLPQIQGVGVGEPHVEKGRFVGLADLEKRQEDILKRLNGIKQRVIDLGGAEVNEDSLNGIDIVIKASPAAPPHSLPLVCNYLQKVKGIKLFISTYVHSSLPRGLPQRLQDFLPEGLAKDRSDASIKISFIWKEVGDDLVACLEMLSEKPVRGEITILRFLFRSFGILGYDTDGPEVTKEDDMLDTIHQKLWAAGEERKASAQSFCGKMKGGFLGPNSTSTTPSISDFLLYSFIKSTVQKPQGNVVNYLKSCEDFCCKG